MALLVTLHVYSGQPDPVWSLSETDEKDLVARLADTSGLDRALVRGLGYRGFSVMRTDVDDEAQPMPFENAESDEIVGSFVSEQPELEDFLLWTAEDAIDDELATYVREEILSKPEAELTADVSTSSGCPPCGGGNAPTYNPGYWNNDGNRRRNNNCYNYANNRATNTFAQPGRGSGSQYTSINCSNVGSAASRDGLVRVSTFRASRPGWYTALVIWPGRDYHWYRQDTNGCWSHKPGRTNARNTDDSGLRIVDPQTCNRGPYRNFCSYYATNNGVRIW